MDSMRKPQTDEVARGPGTGESMESIIHSKKI